MMLERGRTDGELFQGAAAIFPVYNKAGDMTHFVILGESLPEGGTPDT